MVIALTGCANGKAGSLPRTGKKGLDDEAAPVTVARVEQRDVPVEIQTIGSVEAYSTISVKALVTGVLTKSYFQDGDTVKKGDVLLTIDPRPYQAALQEALENLEHDQAALQEARDALVRDQDSLRYQQDDTARNATLLQQRVISKDQFDQIEAGTEASEQTVKADQAAVAGAQAQRDISRAAVEQARVQLSYTTIHAPVDGRTGSLAVDEGNVVTANGAQLLTINQVSPIYVTFTIAESYLDQVRQRRKEQKLRVSAHTQGAAGVKETGVLTFVDNAVDTTTGTIKLKATFPNERGTLWPGQFVTVKLRIAELRNAILAPNQAIQSGPAGSFVYVVRPDSRVEVRPIETGLRLGPEMVIIRGLAPGDVVVTEGQLRLAPNTRVAIRKA